ncbi:MAG: response regulator transcription factor [Lacipirellulaceae bacterium]
MATASNHPPSIRVVLVEDHAMFRQGLVALFNDQPNLEVVGEAVSAEEGISLLMDLKPDVAVIDLRLEGKSGIELLKEWRKAEPTSAAVILTSSRKPEHAVSAAEAGALGYVLKDEVFADLTRAVEEAYQGRRFYSAGVSNLLVGHQVEPAPSLSARELEVLNAVANGDTNKRIASKLGISVKTVESHRSNIMRKLEVGSVAELVRTAIDLELIDSQ